MFEGYGPNKDSSLIQKSFFYANVLYYKVRNGGPPFFYRKETLRDLRDNSMASEEAHYKFLPVMFATLWRHPELIVDWLAPAAREQNPALQRLLAHPTVWQTLVKGGHMEKGLEAVDLMATEDREYLVLYPHFINMMLDHKEYGRLKTYLEENRLGPQFLHNDALVDRMLELKQFDALLACIRDPQDFFTAKTLMAKNNALMDHLRATDPERAAALIEKARPNLDLIAAANEGRAQIIIRSVVKIVEPPPRGLGKPSP